MLNFSISRIALDDAQIDDMLHGPTGHVGRYMRRKAVEHVTASRALAGKRTGRLARSISWEQRRLKRSQRITVTAGTTYAYYHHEGTKPHVIRAKEDGGRLVFRSGPRIVKVFSVNHPGNRANPFLTSPIRAVWGG